MLFRSLRGKVWGERWEGASGLGTRIHPWRIHVDVWQNQYNIVKEKKKKEEEEEEKKIFLIKK